MTRILLTCLLLGTTGCALLEQTLLKRPTPASARRSQSVQAPSDPVEAELLGQTYRHPNPSFLLTLGRKRMEELERVKKQSSTRTHSDDALLAAIHNVASSLYLFPDHRSEAVSLWRRARELATDHLPNVGAKDEILSPHLRSLLLIGWSFEDSVKHGKLTGLTKTVEGGEQLLAAHEQEFLEGQQSQRGRAALAVLRKMYAGAQKQIEGRDRAWKQYHADPRKRAIDREAVTLTRQAESLAKRLGYQSRHYHEAPFVDLRTLGKRLLELNTEDAFLREKYGLE